MESQGQGDSQGLGREEREDLKEGSGNLGPLFLEPPLMGSQSSSAGSRAAHVPGARATTGKTSTLWCAMPGWLFGEATLFAKFFRGCVSSTLTQRLPATAAAFSMPLPYPQLYRRSGRRAFVRRADQHAVNLVLVMLSWKALGSPAFCPGWLATGFCLTGEQRGVARRLEAAVRVLTRHPVVGFADMGRSAACVETLEHTLQRLSEIVAKFGSPSGSLWEASTQLSWLANWERFARFFVVRVALYWDC